MPAYHETHEAPHCPTCECGAEKYKRLNPLGGPAKTFDAMASRIRAGEGYFEVLADYGFCLESAYNDLLKHALALIDIPDAVAHKAALEFVESRRNLLPPNVGGNPRERSAAK